MVWCEVSFREHTPLDDGDTLTNVATLIVPLKRGPSSCEIPLQCAKSVIGVSSSTPRVMNVGAPVIPHC
jgi:hypothetical protein